MIDSITRTGSLLMLSVSRASKGPGSASYLRNRKMCTGKATDCLLAMHPTTFRSHFKMKRNDTRFLSHQTLALIMTD